MDARFRVVNGQVGGAIILAGGPRLAVDEAGCVTVPGEFAGHPHLARMIQAGRLVEVKGEVETKVEAEAKSEFGRKRR